MRTPRIPMNILNNLYSSTKGEKRIDCACESSIGVLVIACVKRLMPVPAIAKVNNDPKKIVNCLNLLNSSIWSFVYFGSRTISAIMDSISEIGVSIKDARYIIKKPMLKYVSRERGLLDANGSTGIIPAIR